MNHKVYILLLSNNILTTKEAKKMMNIIKNYNETDVDGIIFNIMENIDDEINQDALNQCIYNETRNDNAIIRAKVIAEINKKLANEGLEMCARGTLN